MRRTSAACIADSAVTFCMGPSGSTSEPASSAPNTSVDSAPACSRSLFFAFLLSFLVGIGCAFCSIFTRGSPSGASSRIARIGPRPLRLLRGLLSPGTPASVSTVELNGLFGAEGSGVSRASSSAWPTNSWKLLSPEDWPGVSTRCSNLSASSFDLAIFLAASCGFSSAQRL